MDIIIQGLGPWQDWPMWALGNGVLTHGDEGDRQWTLIAKLSVSHSDQVSRMRQSTSVDKPGADGCHIGNCGALTEDGAGSIVTGETGLAHTRTTQNIVSIAAFESGLFPSDSCRGRRRCGWGVASFRRPNSRNLSEASGGW